MPPIERDTDRDPDARERTSDRFIRKFGSDLIKIAIALLIAWFGVKERVSGLEKEISFSRAEIARLDRDVQYLRQRIDGARQTQVSVGGSDVPPIPR